MATPSTALPTLPFDNSYARLPERLFTRTAPTPVAAPRLLGLNAPLARQLGLDPEALAGPAGVAMLAGNHVPAEADPLAMAYAGHQFGNWVPRLGDGRALLLGELVDRQGVRQDIQLKGAGRTPWSRGGDGRSWLGPVLREYVVSEAMHALGIPTSRALAAVATGEHVQRETVLPGAVLTRVSRSHVRVGTFEYFAAREDTDALRALLDYIIERQYPALRDAAEPATALLDAAIERQTALIAGWQAVGFIHGVMNTDNASVSGDTIDYGPCAFLDTYDSGKVFSSIDQMGRYAYANQPGIGQWNMASLAQCLLPLIDPDPDRALTAAQELINTYPARYQARWLEAMRTKLGLTTADAGDGALISEWLTVMADGHADFTRAFRALGHLVPGAAVPAGVPDGGNASQGDRPESSLTGLFSDAGPVSAWLEKWRQRLALESVAPDIRRQSMLDTNPAVIPRNHQIEAMITAAVEQDDYTLFHRLQDALTRPFVETADNHWLQMPPRPEEEVRQTFCGT